MNGFSSMNNFSSPNGNSSNVNQTSSTIYHPFDPKFISISRLYFSFSCIYALQLSTSKIFSFLSSANLDRQYLLLDMPPLVGSVYLSISTANTVLRTCVQLYSNLYYRIMSEKKSCLLFYIITINSGQL